MPLQESDEEGVGLLGSDLESPAVETEKSVVRKERDTFISVKKRMVHDEGFE